MDKVESLRMGGIQEQGKIRDSGFELMGLVRSMPNRLFRRYRAYSQLQRQVIHQNFPKELPQKRKSHFEDQIPFVDTNTKGKIEPPGI